MGYESSTVGAMGSRPQRAKVIANKAAVARRKIPGGRVKVLKRRLGSLGAQLTDAEVWAMTIRQNEAIAAWEKTNGRKATDADKLKIIAQVQKTFGLAPKFDAPQLYDPKTGAGVFNLDSILGTKPQTPVSVVNQKTGREAVKILSTPVTAVSDTLWNFGKGVVSQAYDGSKTMFASRVSDVVSGANTVAKDAALPLLLLGAGALAFMAFNRR